MRPFRASVWGCAAAVIAATAGPTQAAWNNVFEACCWHCKHNEATANYPPAAPSPSPASSLASRNAPRATSNAATTSR